MEEVRADKKEPVKPVWWCELYDPSDKLWKEVPKSRGSFTIANSTMCKYDGTPHKARLRCEAPSFEDC